MIYINVEKLKLDLKKSLNSCYILLGQDYFLIKKSIKYILNNAKKKKFNDYLTLTLDSNSDWNYLFYSFKTLNLFNKRRIFNIIIPKKSIFINFEKKIKYLISLLNKNLLLIISIYKLNISIKNNIFLKNINFNIIIVNCYKPRDHIMINWLINKFKKKFFKIEKKVIDLLCKYYEGNLLALEQILYKLLLIYPNEKITLLKVNNILDNIICFSSYKWIEAILERKIESAINILYELKKNNIEPIILLRILQKYIVKIFILKKKMLSLKELIIFKKTNFYMKNSYLFEKYINSITIHQLKNSILLMTKIEINIKNDNNNFVWIYFKILTVILCGKIISNYILDEI